MRLFFEQREIGLAHDRGIGVVHLLEQDLLADGLIALFGQQLIGQHHFAEGGGGLCQRQRCLERERAVLFRQHRMDGVPEFMCHYGHVARPALIIEQNIRRHFRQDRRAERAAVFPFADLAVEMVLIEDAPRQLCKFRVERPRTPRTPFGRPSSNSNFFCAAATGA